MSRAGIATKLDILDSALSKMSISGITAPPQASDFQTLLQRLEGLMYELEESRNICCQYNFTEQPDTADSHGMDFGLFEPIANILALRTLQDYGLTPNPALLASAAAGVTSLSNQTFTLRETQYPRRQGRGAGNTLRYNRWQRFYRQPERPPLDCNTYCLQTEEINDFSESWIDYLKAGESIASHQISLTGGLTLISNSQDDNTILYRLRGENPSADNGSDQVRLRITTSTGRVNERLISFEVLPITLEQERFTAG